ncbi:MAG: HU family DNA-binding protein [Bacteroidales bacterium]|nr:HU family DNA-binding protein [Bacteroidales bacterium]
MEQYIKELLQPGKRVNLPGFGAFIAPNDGASSILFNQYLNFNDGLLSNYIVQKEGVTPDEALQKINDFVADIKSRLERGETVTLNGLGTISQADGKITFRADDNGQPADSTDDGIDDLVLPTDDKGSEEPQPSNEEQQQNEEQPSNNSEPEPQPFVSVPVQPAVTVETTPEPEQKTDNAAETSDSNNTVIINNYDEEEKKPKTWLWVLLIILLLFIIAFVCLFIINKDNCVYKFFFGEKVEVVEPIPIKDPEPAPKDTIVVPPPAPVTNPLEKRYNIVVGCYKTMELAEARVATLKSKGFTSAFATQLDGWFAAVIESHSSLVEAEARQELIVDTYRIESWITNAGE